MSINTPQSTIWRPAGAGTMKVAGSSMVRSLRSGNIRSLRGGNVRAVSAVTITPKESTVWTS